MTEKARERIQALGNQLSPLPAKQNEGGIDSNKSDAEGALPPIQKVAGKSAGPRVEGKIIIVTGT